MDSLPVTGVGKVFKPSLRSDATRRLVETVVSQAEGNVGATIIVTQGGKRGSTVEIRLPANASEQKPAVEAALSGYLFESKVIVSGG